MAVEKERYCKDRGCVCNMQGEILSGAAARTGSYKEKTIDRTHRKVGREVYKKYDHNPVAYNQYFIIA